MRHGLGAVVRKILAPVEERTVDPVPGVEPLFDPGRLVIQHEGRLRIWERYIIECIGVLLFRRVEAVRRLVADHETPGLVVTRTFQPLLGHIGHDLGVVPRHDLTLFAVDVELGIEVLPLPFVRNEPVETGTRFVVVLAHMPLTDIGGVVPLPLQHQREALQLGWVLREVIHDAMVVGVESTQDARAAGRTERGRAEGVLKIDTFVPQPIHVRRLELLVAGQPNCIPALIVGQHEQDVGALGLNRPRHQHQNYKSQKSRESSHLRLLPFSSIVIPATLRQDSMPKHLTAEV